MIDPWKFNPLTDLGKKAGNLPGVQYIKEVLGKEPKVLEKVKEFRKEVKEGKRTTIDNSNELFL